MFAIVLVGGKQYRAEEGGELVVDRMDVAPGKTVELDSLLVADGKSVHLAGEGKKSTVTAEVVEHFRGPRSSSPGSSPNVAGARRPVSVPG